MLLALLQNLLAAVNKILTKKSLMICDAHVMIFQLTAAIVFPLVILFFIFTDRLELYLASDIFFLFLIFCSLSIFFVKNPLLQKVYKEEKIQAIMPFENINQFIIIITSFFIFSKDSSLITLLVTIVSVLIIFLYKFDLKSFTLPKNINLILWRQSLQAVHTLLMWYILSLYTFSAYYLFYVMFLIIFAFLFLMVTKKLNEFKKLSVYYYKIRFYTSLVWTSSYILFLYFVNEFWLVVSTLFWLFWMISTTALSVLFLKEKLSYKDLFISISIAILTFIWFYFK